MNNREIEERISALEKIINTAEGRSYRMVIVTLGFQMNVPSKDLYAKWLHECGVAANDLLIFPNRIGSRIPLIGFLDGDEPPADWLIVENLPPEGVIEGLEGSPKKWTHPHLTQSFKAWLKPVI
jgi:hypothetical protein